MPAKNPTKSVLTHHFTPITLAIWQKSSDRVEWARNLFQHVHFRELLSMLQNEMPVTQASADNERAAFAGAFTGGYAHCLKVLMGTTEPAEEQESEPEVNYGVEDDGKGGVVLRDNAVEIEGL